MRTMQARLGTDEDLAADYKAAHEHYLAERNAIESLGTDFSGGGMPDRVKCLHVLIAYALAEGPDRYGSAPRRRPGRRAHAEALRYRHPGGLADPGAARDLHRRAFEDHGAVDEMLYEEDQ